jgi:predicted anti-sigma-YlaC factor YlaD
MREKLGAYLDGELRGHALSEMQAHLQTCPECQAELDELRQLSHLLRTAPQPEFTPASRFASQLMFKLPRREETSQRQKVQSWAVWLIPATLLAAMVFIQVTTTLTALLTWAGHAGWLRGAAAWVIPSQEQVSWVAATQALLGNSLTMGTQANLEWINDVGLFLVNVIVPFFWQIVITIMYWAWLAVWLQRRQVKNGLLSTDLR